MSPIEDEAVVAALIAKCGGAVRLVDIEYVIIKKYTKNGARL